MINNDDEQAFPMKEPLTSDQLGMTLRYFAAKAMQAIITRGESFETINAARVK